MNDMCGIEVYHALSGLAVRGDGNPGLRFAIASLHPGLLHFTPLGLGGLALRSTGKILVLLMLAFGLLATTFSQTKKKPAPAIAPKPSAALDDEEYAVYSALIQSLYTSGAKVSVIDNFVSGCVPVGNNAEGERSWQQSLDKLPSKLPKLSPKTIADFKSKSRTCRTIEAKFTLPTKYILISQAERRAIFSKADVNKSWQSFQQKYPGANGYINLSNIGFNEDRSQALVDTFRKCGDKCGGEKMVLLTKVNGKWSVTATHKIWEL